MYNASHSYVKISVDKEQSWADDLDVRAPLVFSSSSLKQHNMASPPLLHVPGDEVYLGLLCHSL